MKEKYGLRECMVFENDLEILKERQELGDRNKYIVAGVLQRADAQNGNGRVYPYAILQREIENYKQLVKERRALGELDHADESVISLKNVSHVITDIWMEGKDVKGKVEILETPAGETLRKLFEADIKIGISSRGLGSTRDQGGNVLVEDDFQLICFDFVSDPSTQGAFMERVTLRENRDPRIWTKNYKVNRILNDILGV